MMINIPGIEQGMNMFGFNIFCHFNNCIHALKQAKLSVTPAHNKWYNKVNKYTLIQ